eukprot:6728059-Prymnesium_polylepis.5
MPQSVCVPSPLPTLNAQIRGQRIDGSDRAGFGPHVPVQRIAFAPQLLRQCAKATGLEKMPTDVGRRLRTQGASHRTYPFDEAINDPSTSVGAEHLITFTCPHRTGLRTLSETLCADFIWTCPA